MVTDQGGTYVGGTASVKMMPFNRVRKPTSTSAVTVTTRLLQFGNVYPLSQGFFAGSSQERQKELTWHAS